MDKKSTKATMKECTEYEVVREWVEDGYRCTQLRNLYNGAKIISRIPIRSPDSPDEIAVRQNTIIAAFKMVYPDRDISGVNLTLFSDD